MQLRLIEVLVPQSSQDDLDALLSDAESLETWREPVMGERMLVRVLVEAVHAEPVLDAFERRFAHLDNFRAVLLRVHATVPRPQEDPEDREDPEEAEPEKPKLPLRVSREELLAEMSSGTSVTSTYLATVLLSAIVAASGLYTNNVAVIIGAMVIAPLLTPNMALALATTLGDLPLIRKALVTNFVGVLVAFCFAVFLGWMVEFDPSSPEIAARLNPWFPDLILALAAGSAGALAFTAGVPAGLVGVMVAVALLPPLIVGGALLGSGHADRSGGAFLLLFCNIICINLSAVTTFLIKGVRPRSWWEADRARRASRHAVAIWTVLLVVLAFLLALLDR